MRKLILLLVISIISFQTSFATDACDKIILQKAEFVGEVVKGVNVRSYPCTYKSKVIRGAKVGERFKIIAKVDGYYKIRLTNGEIVWVWDQAIKKIGELAEEDKGQEVKEIIKPYALTANDYIVINKINEKIEDIVNDRGYKYKAIFVSKLQKLLVSRSRSDKFITVINRIIKDTKKLSLKENSISHYNKYKIDINKVKDYWLDLHNTERKKMGLASMSYDNRLDNTAYEWSQISLDKGVMEHKRDYFDSEYDYKKIENWFQERGVKCKVKARTTSSESIGKFAYLCKDSDCSDELYKTTKTIFDIYMAEKGTSYTPHYRAIAHANISKIGLGFSITGPDKDGFYDYYITTHYCTEFEG